MSPDQLIHKKIVVITQTYPSHKRPLTTGGSEVVIHALIKKLSSKNHVTIIAPSNFTHDTELTLLPNTQINRIGTSFANQPLSIYRVIKLAFFQLKIVRFIVTSNFDYIIGGDFSSFLTAILCSYVGHTKAILYWCDILGKNWLKYFGFSGLFGLIVESISRHSHTVHWCLSKSLQTKLASPNTSYVVLPSDLNLQFKSHLRPDKKNVILSVGRLVNYKNTLSMVQVFANSKLRDSYHYYLIGSGPLTVQINQFIKTNHLVNAVTLTPQLSHEELMNNYSKAKIFLHLSDIEGYSLVINEALSANCEVIAKNLPIYKEFYSHNPRFHTVSSNSEAIHLLNSLSG